MSTYSWAKALIATANAIVGGMTLLWRDWIEVVFHIDPDSHSGAAEWSLVIATLAASVLFAYSAAQDRRVASSRTA